MKAKAKLTRREYFQEIERVFIELRGAPLLLSPADWQRAKSWHTQGVPLSVVEGAIREVFERREERVQADSGSTDRIHRLSYCAAAVERDWKALQEIQGPGVRDEQGRAGAASGGAESAGTSAAGTQSRLEQLAARLPETLPEVESWRAQLVGLEGTEEGIEAELKRLDDALLDRFLDGLHEAARSEVEARVESALDRVRSRFGAGEVATLRQRLLRQQLRNLGGVPRLSLYS